MGTRRERRAFLPAGPLTPKLPDCPPEAIAYPHTKKLL